MQHASDLALRRYHVTMIAHAFSVVGHTEDTLWLSALIERARGTWSPRDAAALLHALERLRVSESAHVHSGYCFQVRKDHPMAKKYHASFLAVQYSVTTRLAVPVTAL